MSALFRSGTSARTILLALCCSAFLASPACAEESRKGIRIMGAGGRSGDVRTMDVSPGAGGSTGSVKLDADGKPTNGTARQTRRSSKFEPISETEFAELAKKVSRERGLRTYREIVPNYVSKKRMYEVIRGEMMSNFGDGQLDDYVYGLESMGLWPRGESLIEQYSDSLGEGVAGLYLPGKRQVYIVNELPARFLREFDDDGVEAIRDSTLAHEIVHSLQHESYPHFFEQRFPSYFQDDLALAMRTAIEGDALFYGIRTTIEDTRYLLPGAWFEFAVENMSTEAFAAPEDDSPLYLRKSFIFPYLEGYSLSFEEGPRLLVKPPISSEQARHKNKRRQSFYAISLVDMPAPAGKGCRRVHENTMGELGIEVMFTDADTSIGNAAWEGWDGDRYLVGRCPWGSEILWLSYWDTEDDAKQFARRYRSAAVALVENSRLSRPARVRRDGKAVIVSTPGYAEAAETVASKAEKARIAEYEKMKAWIERQESRIAAASVAKSAK